jgi:hypothetical protein
LLLFVVLGDVGLFVEVEGLDIGTVWWVEELSVENMMKERKSGERVVK